MQYTYDMTRLNYSVAVIAEPVRCSRDALPGPQTLVHSVNTAHIGLVLDHRVQTGVMQ